MPITFSCSFCDKKLKVADNLAGKKVKCPACQQVVPVPAPEVEPVAEVEPVPVLSPADEPAPKARPKPAAKSRPEPLPVEPIDDDPGKEFNDHGDDDWNDHGGNPIPPNGVFFAPPPKKIGPVLSAYTTLRRGKKPWPAWAVFLTTVTVGLLGLGLGFGIDVIFQVENWIWWCVWPVAGLLLGLLSGFAFSYFMHTCTYVGEHGVAQIKCEGSNRTITSEVFLFRDATELRTSLVKTYKNGFYQHTDWKYEWTDVGGRVRFKLEGQHTKEDDEPVSTDPYHFARAAQVAWTTYLLDQAHAQLTTSDAVKFNLKKGKWVKIGKSGLTFKLNDGEPVKLRAKDLDAVEAKDGNLSFKSVDAQEGWFSSTGVYKFAVSDLANAMLFYHLLDELLGYRFD